jgi:O-antigen/teichoic acid export membrane protein
MQRLSLRKNFIWTFAGNLIYSGSQWGIIVLLAKMCSPEVVGNFSYALALTAPIILFSNLRLMSAQATDQNYDFCFGHYMATRILTTILAIIVILILALFFHENLAIFKAILIIGIAKGIESISDIIHGLFQQEERMDRISKSLIMRGLISLFSVGFLLFYSGELFIALFGLLFSLLFVLFAYDMPQARILLKNRSKEESLKPVWDFKYLRSLVLLTLPLGGSMALGSLYTNLPRYFVEHQLGLYQLGLFSALAYFMVAGNTVVNAISQSVTPRLAHLYALKEFKSFKVLLFKLVAIGIVLGLSGIIIVSIFGKEILEIFYTVDYSSRSDIFLWLMVASGVTYSYLFLGSAINAIRLFRLQLIISFISVLLLFVLCFVFIGPFGLMGVVFAVIFVKVIEAILFSYFIYRYIFVLE